ncbi:MAG: hypothetical protein ACLPKB_29465 [Xanthobacteraceae bacterium]
MRTMLAALIVFVFGPLSAQAEKRVFVIANNTDYGVDRCLSSGAACGAAVATAYCRSREFAEAISYRKVDRDDITGGVPASGGAACRSSLCEDFVAIECTR